MPKPTHALGLRLLRSAARIRCEDSRWISLLRRLWEPFVVARSPADAKDLVISAASSGWSFRLGDKSPLSNSDPWLLANEMRHALSELAVSEATNVVDLHAAALARRDRAVLLVGASGAGKTTLALALRDEGWRLLSDDVAPLEAGAAAVLPFPLPVGIKDPRRWSDLTADSPPSWPPPASDTFLIPAGPVGMSGAAGPGVKVAVVTFITFKAGADAKLEVVSPGTALLDCFRFTKRDPRAALPALTALCSQARSVRLVYGSTEAGKSLLQTLLAKFTCT